MTISPVALHTVLTAVAAAGAWVVAFDINAWVFEHFEMNPVVNWIFLPAPVRLLAVLLGGWPGAVGLGLGMLITNIPVFGTLSIESIGLAIVVPAGQIVVIGAVRALLKTPATLQGLTPTALAILAAASVTASVALNTLAFRLYSMPTGSAPALLAMFVGDLLGTVIVLSALRMLLTAWDRVYPDGRTD